MNKRIGTIREDGSRNWPETNIEGGDYDRSATVFKLDKTHFVVMPVNFEKRWTPDAIRAEFTAFSPVEPLVTVDHGKPSESAPTPAKKAGDGKP